MTDKQNIVTLREETGAGVLDCKNALEEAGGDLDNARKIIAKKGYSKAQKKSERATDAGVLETYSHNGRIAVMLDLRCETDFVAKNKEFRELAHNIAMQIASMNPENVDELMDQPFIKDDSVTVRDMLTALIAKTGENMKVERFCRYEL